jgi:hypothetical protein
MGDRLHSEITDRGQAAVRKLFDDEEVTLSEDEWLCVQIGVQAGFNATLQILIERG